METCNALNTAIEGAGESNRGDCTVDMECLVVTCIVPEGNDAGNVTVTIFPCEEPILVNYRNVGGRFALDVNITEDFSQPVGLGSSFNIVLQQLSNETGIRFGVSALTAMLSSKLSCFIVL